MVVKGLCKGCIREGMVIPEQSSTGYALQVSIILPLYPNISG